MKKFNLEISETLSDSDTIAITNVQPNGGRRVIANINRCEGGEDLAKAIVNTINSLKP